MRIFDTKIYNLCDQICIALLFKKAPHVLNFFLIFG